MAIETETYADGVYQIHVLGNTVRLDLMRLQPSPENNGKPIPKPFERIILDINAFLNTYGAMGTIIQQLEKNGIIKRNPPAQQ